MGDKTSISKNRGTRATVAISAHTAVVGAPNDDDDKVGDNSGSAYILLRNKAGDWMELKKIIASDADSLDHFGEAVAISGDLVVVGVRRDDHDSGANSGSAYVFGRDHGGVNNWGEVQKITASDAAANDFFGISASVSGSTLVVGAHFNDDTCPTDPNCKSGTAYVFSATPESPVLTLPSSIPTPSNLAVDVPITFTGNDQNIAATTFSVDFDESCLVFDPTDADSDGVPDDVNFSVPMDFTPSVTFASGDTQGELDFSVADFSTPLAPLPDGVLATVTLTPICLPFRYRLR